jgi:hypothetical protein
VARLLLPELVPRGHELLRRQRLRSQRPKLLQREGVVRLERVRHVRLRQLRRQLEDRLSSLDLPDIGGLLMHVAQVLLLVACGVVAGYTASWSP